MSLIAQIHAVAARQHGLVHLAQLREMGVSPKALQWALAAGELIRRLPEVYAVAGAPRTWRQEVMAAVLDAWPHGVASHRTAAILLAVADRNASPVIEITVPNPFYSRSPGVIVHRSKDLRPEEHVIVVDGIPCTGPLRTLVDLGAVEPWFIVSDALERALQAGLVTMLGAEWMLTNLSRRGRNGTGVFRRVLDERALATVSPHPGLLEPRMARILRGIEGIEYQYKVFDQNGLFVAQVDFAHPASKEAFEVDGFEKHGTPEAMTGGFDRDHRIRQAGWNVTHFTWKHCVRRPTYVQATVRSVLRAHATV